MPSIQWRKKRQKHAITRLGRKLAVAGAAVGLWAAVLASPASATVPEVTTGSAQNITQSTATLNGTIDTGGYYTLWGIQYGTTQDYGRSGSGNTPIPAGRYSPVSVSVQLSSLEPNTTYHYRVGAYANGNLVYGEDRTFTTLAPQLPSFQAGAYSASVSGAESATDPLQLAIYGTEVDCAISFSGSVPAPNSTLPVGGSFDNCSYNGFRASVDMNSCHFVLSVTNAGPPYVGTPSLKCYQPTDGITVDIPNYCDFELTPRSVGSSVRYTNQGSGGTRTVDAKIHQYVDWETVRGSGPYCALYPDSETDELYGTMTLRGANSSRSQVGFFIAGEAVDQVGVYMASGPEFAAESYPQALLSEQDLEGGVTVLETSSSAQVTCESGGWSGTLSEASDSLSLDASFGNCTFMGFPATVTTSNCGYTLSADSEGPPYRGSVAISCDSGYAISVDSELCTLMIPPQSLGGSVTYTTLGSGSSRMVDVDVWGTDVETVMNGAGCFMAGDGTGGLIDFGFRLYAFE